MPPIRNKSVLVIGGSSGIGYAVADGALAEGARVRIASSNASRVQQSVAALKQKHPEGDVAGYVCDLTSPDLEQKLDELLAAVQPLDHVVITAADKLPIKPLAEISLDAIYKASRAAAARQAPPALHHARLPPLPNWSLIGGFLTGLQGLTRNLALDLKPLRVNVVSPGPVATPYLGPPSVADQFKEHTTLGKIGTPEEVAEAYLYLMKDTNVTGSMISTNSGALLV
ncbi:05404047-edc2-4d85-87e7-47175a46504c [Thermothielavioides terrestris]|uniref:05404047-edc2-4d85-87e7-47175a46504c n=1 Tax=Thermothielavioides terrestris TaxID=2587410 RepID=A0A446B5D4_9PEZI|nr:05404047-edc2-4d85-87e7-47175a46504c [Thermothielavioides terrestris]